MLQPGRNKVDGRIQPAGLVFATCALTIAAREPEEMPLFVFPTSVFRKAHRDRDLVSWPHPVCSCTTGHGPNEYHIHASPAQPSAAQPSQTVSSDNSSKCTVHSGQGPEQHPDLREGPLGPFFMSSSCDSYYQASLRTPEEGGKTFYILATQTISNSRELIRNVESQATPKTY